MATTGTNELTPQQIEQLWINAGGPPDVAPLMAAIGMQQSGGNPAAVNPKDPGPYGSRGIWQINSAAHPQYYADGGSAMENAEQNAAAAVAIYKANGLQPWATVNRYENGKVVGTMENPVVTAYNQAGGQAAGEKSFQAALTAAGTASMPAPGSTEGTSIGAGAQDQASVPASQFLPPEKGVDIHHFGATADDPQGFDLSAIPANELGNAEAAITKYLSDATTTVNGKTMTYAAALQQRIQQDYGYEGDWILNLPGEYGAQVKAVAIWAMLSQDMSTAAGKSALQGAIANTEWYKTMDQNQRAYWEAVSTDPATVANQVAIAKDKVLGIANQIGVQLSQSQLDRIATMYAQNAYQPSGTYSAMSGTSAEWLDQAVESAIVATTKPTAPGVGVRMPGAPESPLASQPQGTSDFSQATQGYTTGTGLTGIAADIYNQFVSTAQQYLMYNPNGGGLMTEKDILNDVQNALKTYTGTGASGQITQFVNGVVDQFTEQMKEQASRYYPSLASAIAAGTLPSSFASGYTNTISQTLGLDPGSINYNSPQWNWVLGTPDPKTGKKTALTLDQVQQKLVEDPKFGWQKTSGAKTDALSITAALNQAFGFGGA